MEKLQLAISGMSCGHCVSRVTKALGQLQGVAVEHVEVGSARVSYDPAQLSPERVAQAVDEIGFPAQLA
jgi:copper chaperone